MASSNPYLLMNGRIGTDIKVRSVGNSTVAEFRLITNDRRKNDKGEWEDVKTSGWSVEVWDKLAEKVKDHLEKGDPVLIWGKVFEDTWEDSNGVRQYKTMVRAEDIGLNILLAK